MEVKASDPVVIYSKKLFGRGLEVYDRETRLSHNIGGAQLYQVPNWKNNQSQITFNKEQFGKVLRGMNVYFYSTNCIDVDKEGQPRKVPGTNLNKRILSGILLYTQFGQSGESAKEYSELIVQSIPELSGYVAAAVDIFPHFPELEGILSKFPMQSISDSTDAPEYMNPKKVIILNVSSGSQNSSQYWSFNRKNNTRSALNAINTANPGIGSDVVT